MLTWIELVQEVATEMGWDCDPEYADYILYEYTGFPSFWDGDNPAECCRKQLREYFASRGVPPRPDAPTIWDHLAHD